MSIQNCLKKLFTGKEGGFVSIPDFESENHSVLVSNLRFTNLSAKEYTLHHGITEKSISFELKEFDIHMSSTITLKGLIYNGHFNFGIEIVNLNYFLKLKFCDNGIIPVDSELTVGDFRIESKDEGVKRCLMKFLTSVINIKHLILGVIENQVEKMLSSSVKDFLEKNILGINNFHEVFVESNKNCLPFYLVNKNSRTLISVMKIKSKRDGRTHYYFAGGQKKDYKLREQQSFIIVPIENEEYLIINNHYGKIYLGVEVFGSRSSRMLVGLKSRDDSCVWVLEQDESNGKYFYIRNKKYKDVCDLNCGFNYDGNPVIVWKKRLGNKNQLWRAQIVPSEYNEWINETKQPKNPDKYFILENKFTKKILEVENGSNLPKAICNCVIKQEEFSHEQLWGKKYLKENKFKGLFFLVNLKANAVLEMDNGSRIRVGRRNCSGKPKDQQLWFLLFDHSDGCNYVINYKSKLCLGCCNGFRKGLKKRPIRGYEMKRYETNQRKTDLKKWVVRKYADIL